MQSIIERQADMEYVGGAEDGYAALKLIEETKPDVVILDARLPGLSSYEIIERIPAKNKLKILAYSAFDSTNVIRKLLLAGAKGYVMKNATSEKLVKSIRIVAEGGNFIDPILNHDYHFYISEPDKLEKLTITERHILKYFSSGHTTIEIADQYCLNPNTVKTHRSNIMKKLELKNFCDFIRFVAINRKDL